MGGTLLNRAATSTEQALPYVGKAYGPRPVAGAMTLNIANAGDSKSGTVIIYFAR